ncbi:MAG: hypothetical protein [Olavius algarvensis Delta 4 endosymbiont]|nr:MAG: hypothetical protein [Olavius algarvensis Delta 4 endosymbiont]
MQQPEKYNHCPLEPAPDIWLLGNYFINLYLVRGRRASALFEMGVSAVVDDVIRQLEGLGIAPDYLVLAHPHTDHLSGLPGLRQRYPGARLVAAEGARNFALHPKALPGMISEDAHITARLGEVGLPAVRPSLQTLSFPADHHVVGQTEDIDLGGVTLRCIPVEGHSPGNLVIHVPGKEALFVSDSLGFHYPGRGFCPLFFTGYAPFMSTLVELEALGPAIVGPGHQGAITGPAAAVVFERAREAADGVLKIVGDGTGEDAIIAEQLFQKYYVDEFTLYSPENIMGCCRLLVRRAREALESV